MNGVVHNGIGQFLDHERRTCRPRSGWRRGRPISVAEIPAAEVPASQFGIISAQINARAAYHFR